MIAPARRNAFEEVLDTAVVSRDYAWHAEAFLRPHRRNGALPLLTKTAAWASVDSPVGGMKESGLRPRHGAEGILKYTASQTVAVQRLLPIAPFGPLDAAAYARWMTRLLGMLRRAGVFG